mmetsp:Transcript_20706/g.59987  ORF Transcript_20706/g.59987 Transcript_20706/m.59987 type:complete len:359 (+) Transcript_20706:31-1107(+)
MRAARLGRLAPLVVLSAGGATLRAAAPPASAASAPELAAVRGLAESELPDDVPENPSGAILVKRSVGHERQYHGHQTCESPVFADVPNGGQALFCFPFKNGWEWWTRTLCISAGGGTECFQTYKMKVDLIDFLWWRHSEAEVRRVYRNESIKKIKLVRNPITRVLAAWLTWVTKKAVGDYNYVEDTFEGFVKNSMATRVNCHWDLQPKFCGEDEGIRWELYKVEDRDFWGPRLLERTGLSAAAQINGGINMQQHQSCPGHGCSAMPLMLKYYTVELVNLVAKFYEEEIRRYNYTEAVRQWEAAIRFQEFEDRLRKDSMLSSLRAKIPQTVSLHEAHEDLRALEQWSVGLAPEAEQEQV